MIDYRRLSNPQRSISVGLDAMERWNSKGMVFRKDLPTTKKHWHHYVTYVGPFSTSREASAALTKAKKSWGEIGVIRDVRKTGIERHDGGGVRPKGWYALMEAEYDPFR